MVKKRAKSTPAVVKPLVHVEIPEWDKLQSQINSIIASVGNTGITIAQLKKDVLDMFAYDLTEAARAYNFTTVEGMLREMHGCVQVRHGPLGGLIVFAATIGSSAHVTELIQKTKSKKNRKPNRAPILRRPGYQPQTQGRASRPPQPQGLQVQRHRARRPQADQPSSSHRHQLPRPASIQESSVNLCHAPGQTRISFGPSASEPVRIQSSQPESVRFQSPPPRSIRVRSLQPEVSFGPSVSEPIRVQSSQPERVHLPRPTRGASTFTYNSYSGIFNYSPPERVQVQPQVSQVQPLQPQGSRVQPPQPQWHRAQQPQVDQPSSSHRPQLPRSASTQESSINLSPAPGRTRISFGPSASEPVRVQSSQPETVRIQPSQPEPVRIQSSQPESVRFQSPPPRSVRVRSPQPEVSFGPSASEPVRVQSSQPERVEIQPPPTPFIRVQSLQPERVGSQLSRPASTQESSINLSPAPGRTRISFGPSASEPVRVQSSQPEPVRIQPSQPEPVQVQSSQLESVGFQSPPPRYVQVRSPQPEVSFGPSASEPVRVQSSQPEPVRIQSSQPEPVRVRSSQPKRVRFQSPPPRYVQVRSPQPEISQVQPERVRPQLSRPASTQESSINLWRSLLSLSVRALSSAQHSGPRLSVPTQEESDESEKPQIRSRAEAVLAEKKECFEYLSMVSFNKNVSA